MAFDIFKNLAGPALPSKEMPELRLPNRPTAPDFRPEKLSDKARSFSDELQANTRQEQAKIAAPVKNAVSQAADAAKGKLDSALRSDAAKVSDAAKGAADQASSPGKDALSKLATELRDDILSSPVAGLLSNPTIQPQDLVGLAQQNKLLSDLLLGDASLTMEQPIEAGELLDALGLKGAEGDLLSGLKAEFGDNLPDFTAADLFAAAGINPQQIIDRLNALRSQFVQALEETPLLNNDTLPDQLVAKNPAASIKDLAGQGTTAPRADMLSGLDPLDEAKRLRTLQDSLVGVQFADPLGQATTLGANSALWSAAAELMNSPGLSAQGKSSVTGLANAQDGRGDGVDRLSDFKEFKTWRDTLRDAKDPVSDRSASQQQAAQSLKGHTATFDGFHQLGERLDRLSPEQVTKVDMSQVSTDSTMDPSTQPVATPRFMDAVVSRFAGITQANVPGTDPTKQTVTPSILDGMQQVVDGAEVNAVDPQRPMHFAKSVTAELQQALAANSGQVTSSLNGTMSRKFTVDELMADVTAGRMNLDFVKEDASSFTGGDSGGDLSQFAKDAMPQASAAMTEKPQAFGSEFAAMLGETKDAAKLGMTPAERAEAAQKVMDSASYLMRQGTGSVRLDLSNSIYGPLEVAINMTDDKVDIRIFTESDPVREAMIADLSRLKEALQTQNVNLNNVEVGVGQQFAGSKGSDQNGQFAQQQDWRETFAQNMISNPRPASSEAKPDVSAAVAARRLNQMTSRIGPDGRLQVRI